MEKEENVQKKLSPKGFTCGEPFTELMRNGGKVCFWDYESERATILNLEAVWLMEVGVVDFTIDEDTEATAKMAMVLMRLRDWAQCDGQTNYCIKCDPFDEDDGYEKETWSLRYILSQEAGSALMKQFLGMGG